MPEVSLCSAVTIRRPRSISRTPAAWTPGLVRRTTTDGACTLHTTIPHCGQQRSPSPHSNVGAPHSGHLGPSAVDRGNSRRLPTRSHQQEVRRRATRRQTGAWPRAWSLPTSRRDELLAGSRNLNCLPVTGPMWALAVLGSNAGPPDGTIRLPPLPLLRKPRSTSQAPRCSARHRAHEPSSERHALDCSTTSLGA